MSIRATVSWGVAISLCLFGSQVVVSGLPAVGNEPIPIADCHVHLLDFLQNGDYLEDGQFVYSSPRNTLPAGQRGKRIEALLAAMDAAGVSHAIVSGMPFVKKWSEDETYRSGYYLDSGSRVVRARDTDYVVALAVQDYLAAGGEAAGRGMERIFPFVSGFDGTDLGAVDMIVKRVKEFPGVFQGVGEVMSRHDDLTNLTTGERPRGNHPSLFRIFDFAGKHGLPVAIHHNIAPISPGDEPKVPRYVDELLDAFDEFPSTDFIWCHAGISRRIIVDGLPGHLDRLLQQHGHHVYIDLSWVVYENYVLQDLDSWVDLIRRHPDNFMIGSDKVARFADYAPEIRKYDRLLDALDDPAIARKVASENMLRIMPETGLTLPADYTYPERRYIWNRLPNPQRVDLPGARPAGAGWGVPFGW
ncbi:MAG: amidohydrolase family protein [Planctomycetota bacterium]|jgi:hypothetical protein